MAGAGMAVENGCNAKFATWWLMFSWTELSLATEAAGWRSNRPTRALTPEPIGTGR